MASVTFADKVRAAAWRFWLKFFDVKPLLKRLQFLFCLDPFFIKRFGQDMEFARRVKKETDPGIDFFKAAFIQIGAVAVAFELAHGIFGNGLRFRKLPGDFPQPGIAFCEAGEFFSVLSQKIDGSMVCFGKVVGR